MGEGGGGQQQEADAEAAKEGAAHLLALVLVEAEGGCHQHQPARADGEEAQAFEETV